MTNVVLRSNITGLVQDVSMRYAEAPQIGDLIDFSETFAFKPIVDLKKELEEKGYAAAGVITERRWLIIDENMPILCVTVEFAEIAGKSIKYRLG